MIAFAYADVALYCGLLLFALRNMFVVVPQHYNEYKMLPIPAFSRKPARAQIAESALPTPASSPRRERP